MLPVNHFRGEFKLLTTPVGTAKHQSRSAHASKHKKKSSKRKNKIDGMKLFGFRPPQTTMAKVLPVFGPLYQKYHVPYNKTTLKKLGQGVLKRLIEKSHRKPDLSVQNIYVPYEICSYSRRKKIIRRRGDHHQAKLMKISTSFKRHRENWPKYLCSKHQKESLSNSIPREYMNNSKNFSQDRFHMRLNSLNDTEDLKDLTREKECESCKTLHKLHLKGQKASIKDHSDDEYIGYFQEKYHLKDMSEARENQEKLKMNNNKKLISFRSELLKPENQEIQKNIDMIQQFKPVSLARESLRSREPSNQTQDFIKSKDLKYLQNKAINDNSSLLSKSSESLEKIVKKDGFVSSPEDKPRTKPKSKLLTESQMMSMTCGSKKKSMKNSFRAQKLSRYEESPDKLVMRLNNSFMPLKPGNRGSIMRTSYSGKSSPVRQFPEAPLKIMVKKYF
ncbi:unnamed protein product [Moneuplotes crassus]|uniref:Uncharacterized protein n=1 Tax=Euplotes crassus TaxID=5936 RepID=A0AAD1X9V9_EUPCR|nr:unnamed protein product [Moneuplotes crassus]